MIRYRMFTLIAAASSMSMTAQVANADSAQRFKMIEQAKEILVEGCSQASGFDIANYQLDKLEDQRLQEIIEALLFNVDSFCVSKELDFMEQGVAKVEEPTTNPATLPK